MNRNHAKRSRQENLRRANRTLIMVFVAVLLIGAFSQVAMIARITGQNKRVRAVETEIRHLSANADNLNLSLNQFRNLDRVAARAAKLGMEEPTGDQIRVVRLPAALENTSTQSAGNTSAEEMKE